MRKPKVTLGLVNPKNPENVDSIMRAAGNFIVEHVYYTGSRYPRAVSLNPENMNIRRKVSQNIPLSGVVCLSETISADSKIICVEFAENAVALPDYQHPENALYIFGPEDGSISQELLDKADATVYIPTQGCMNLSASVSVVLYDRLAKLSLTYEDNELILNNRDQNNRLKVSR